MSGGSGPTPVFGNVGDTDQRSKIGTFNIAPTYTRILNTNAVLNFGGFVRRDGYNYYPSDNPLADLGPIQSETVAQQRSLLNAGAHADFPTTREFTYIKAGSVYQQTFLREHDNFGLVDPTFNSPCVDADGNPQPGSPIRRNAPPPACIRTILRWEAHSILSCCPTTSPAAVSSITSSATPTSRSLRSTSRTRSRPATGSSTWACAAISTTASLSRARRNRGSACAYNIKKTNTVLRVSYARTLETPFNENLVLSSRVL